MAIESILSKLGLNKKEIEIYLAAMQLGPATISEVAKKADIKRPTAYLVIESLLKKGLISIIRKKQKTYYVPERPRKILTMLRARERELEQSLPELEALFNITKAKPIIKIYEGLEAVNYIYDLMYSHLNKKEEALFYTAIGDLVECCPAAYYAYQNRLKQKNDYKIRELNYGDSRGIAYAKKMKKTLGKNHLIRCLDPKLKFQNTDFLIFGNQLFLFSFKEDIFVVQIEHKDIANSFRILFEWAWQMSKKCIY